MSGRQWFIDLKSIQSYVELMGEPTWLDIDEFVVLIDAMDSEYMSWQNARAKGSK